jgi:hypothetical protein
MGGFCYAFGGADGCRGYVTHILYVLCMCALCMYCIYFHTCYVFMCACVRVCVVVCVCACPHMQTCTGELDDNGQPRPQVCTVSEFTI